MSSSAFVAAISAGLVFGSIYALVGIGLNVAYLPTRTFNFAHGPLVMIGLMLTWFLWIDTGLPWPLAAVLVVLICGALSLLIEVIAVAPVLRRATHSHAWILTTLAVALVIEGLADRWFGSDLRTVPSTPGFSLQPMGVGDFAMSSQQLLIIIGAVLVVVACNRVLGHTGVGRAVLAVAEDREAATLNGISPALLIHGAFVASGVVAGLTALLAVPVVFASTGAGTSLLLSGFVALAVGGVGSNWGALVGGLFIGVTENVAIAAMSPTYREATVLAVLLVVLLARPSGFFGRTDERVV